MTTMYRQHGPCHQSFVSLYTFNFDVALYPTRNDLHVNAVNQRAFKLRVYQLHVQRYPLCIDNYAFLSVYLLAECLDEL